MKTSKCEHGQGKTCLCASCTDNDICAKGCGACRLHQFKIATKCPIWLGKPLPKQPRVNKDGTPRRGTV